MEVSAVGFNLASGSIASPAFASCTTQPDNRVRVEAAPGPERFLQLLFLGWNPAGKTRKGPVTDQEVAQWIDTMIQGEASPQEREAFLYQVWPLGWRLVGLLGRFGVKAELLSDEDYLARFGNRSAGQYFSRYKLIRIRRRALFCNRSSTLIHEYGHAIDHLMSSLCNGGNQVSVKLWHWFSRQRGGFVSDYAQKDPAEYFAESLEAYFLHGSYQSLQRADPAMYAFIEDLIAISND